jgi:hypothetical protein
MVLTVILASCSRDGPVTSETAPGTTLPVVEALPARFGSLPLEEKLSGVPCATAGKEA